MQTITACSSDNVRTYDTDMYKISLKLDVKNRIRTLKIFYSLNVIKTIKDLLRPLNV